MVATRGQSSYPGPSADDDRRIRNTNASSSTSTNAGIASYSSRSSHGRAPLPPKPPTRAATNKTPVGSTLKVVIDGSEAAFCHREAEGGWSAMGPLLAIQVGKSRVYHIWECMYVLYPCSVHFEPRFSEVCFGARGKRLSSRFFSRLV